MVAKSQAGNVTKADDSGNAGNAALAKKYQKMEQREHVLNRPGIYIGSIEKDIYNTWFMDENDRMTKKEITYVPGLYKVFDEILVNAIDHATRLKMQGREETHHVKNIKVSIDKETGYIEVVNDGDGIEVALHPEHQIYIPELIFGNLLTSTNYDDKEERVIGGQNGLGSKCISPDTLVPLFNGITKMAKDVVVGDIVIGDDGNQRNVLQTISGTGKMYEVKQHLGDSYKVNSEHTLTLHMPDHKVIFWSTNGWKILWWDKKEQTIKAKFVRATKQEITCDECGIKLCSHLKRHYGRVHPDKEVPSYARKSPTKIQDMEDENIKKAYAEIVEFSKTIEDDNVIDISLRDYMKLSKTTQRRLAGVRGDCVNWEEKAVELDPYVLGLWLGDGDQTGYGYTCDGKNDPEIIGYLHNWGESNDANLKHRGRYYYGFSSTENFRKKGCSPLRKLLKKYDLQNDKHIPKEYLVNSRDIRLKVLAGIIDTDGTVSRDGTRVSITQGAVHKRLVDDIVLLCRSLGFCCSKNEYGVKWSWKGENKTGSSYVLNISGDIADIPTRLPRKKCQNTKSINTDKTTGYIRIKEIDETEYVGIKVDGNERFVINDFTVTHNCTNIFSEHFVVETVDATRKKLYTQEFKANMSEKSAPKIKSCSKKPYTSIRFLPDYKRFGMDGLSNDMYELMKKRVYDACAVTDADVNVHFNGKKLETKTFEKYVDIFIGSKTDQLRVYEKIDDRWEVVAACNDGGFEQVSFVNGIWTVRGGKHVEYITNQIVKKLIDMAQKKKKDIVIKPQYLKDNLIIFVKCTIPNPAFDSQTKETLTTPFSKFGSKPELSDKFIEKLYKSGIIEKASSISMLLDNKNLKKTDGKKRSTIRGLTQLEDANWAGTAKSSQCTLILTEGLSAKTMVMSGLENVGRDKWGVFPLKGKLLNVKDCNVKKIIDNEEITNLKKIIGLEADKKYDDVSDLRYGRIMIMTDSDVDGHHIKGLVFNLFQTLWPSLFHKNGFMTSMLTPIIKATKGNEVICFFTVPDYEKWKREHDTKGYTLKWYKGLGTSNREEACEYFKKMQMLEYQYGGEPSDEKLDLAFNKKKADMRKEWLAGYNREDVLDFDEPKVKFETFVDKELIHFSNYDIQRSIPSMCDGLKTSQRKILWCCLKKDWSKECRVAQLAAHVSEHSAYHHGEESLNNAIIGLAQNFVGSNNINLLMPNGQFGSRIKGGKDSASPRYIHTEINPLSLTLFKKEDMPILTYLDDDGIPIEPEYYVPVIPTVLVNGALGIGTGYSTSIPCFNPIDVVNVLRAMIKGGGEIIDDKQYQLHPWYMGYKGTVIVQDGKYYSKGSYEKIAATKLKVTELPIGLWTEDYKEMLENCLDTKSNILKNYESHFNDIKVEFVLHFTSAAVLDDMLSIDDNGFAKFENEFKLVSPKNLSITNMYLFNSKGQITKYNTLKDIFKEFYTVRMAFYAKRKAHQLERLMEDIKYLEAKARFIAEVIDGTVVINNKKKDDIYEQLKKGGYPEKAGSDGYEYLIGMPIYSLTYERKIKLDKDVVDRKGEYDFTANRTTEEIWIDELGMFEKSYDMYLKKHEASITKGASKKTK